MPLVVLHPHRKSSLLRVDLKFIGSKIFCHSLLLLQLQKMIMKKIVLLTGCVLLTSAAFSQEVGRVLSATQVIQQVSVPRQVCNSEQLAVQAPKSGAGAAMGAIAGGAVGNALGNGSGKAVATVLGLFGGAILGDRVEGAPAQQMQNVQHCTTQNFIENRSMGYNVTYEFAGKQYSVQMPNDPGPTIGLKVTPVMN